MFYSLIGGWLGAHAYILDPVSFLAICGPDRGTGRIALIPAKLVLEEFQRREIRVFILADSLIDEGILPIR